MSTWCSKHVEASNKLIIKFSASSFLILRINILRCTVSKILKKKQKTKANVNIAGTAVVATSLRNLVLFINR